MAKFMQELDEFVSSKNLVDTSWSLFWRNYDDYIAGCPVESKECSLIDRSSICSNLDSICYKHFLESDHVYLIVRISIKNQNAQYLGYYDVCFSEAGEVEDDFFVIE